MSLTAEEKEAGRVFAAAQQAALDARNSLVPPGGQVDPGQRVVRHHCPERGGASTGITLQEHYAQDGPLAFIWKDGRCADCGLVLRSARGKIVLAAERPAEQEKPVRA